MDPHIRGTGAGDAPMSESGGPLVVNGQVQEAVDGALKAFFRDYGAR